jgi:hypothetical protein
MFAVVIGGMILTGIGLVLFFILITLGLIGVCL